MVRMWRAESGHSSGDPQDVVDIIPADVVAAALLAACGFVMQVRDSMTQRPLVRSWKDKCLK
jgi:hypothetical protein